MEELGKFNIRWMRLKIISGFEYTEVSAKFLCENAYASVVALLPNLLHRCYRKRCTLVTQNAALLLTENAALAVTVNIIQ